MSKDIIQTNSNNLLQNTNLSNHFSDIEIKCLSVFNLAEKTAIINSRSKKILECTNDEIGLSLTYCSILLSLKEPDEGTMNIIIGFLRENASNTPLNDIIHSFKMAVSKQLSIPFRLKDYYQFSALLIMDVLEVYNEFKNKSYIKFLDEKKRAESYNKPKMSVEEVFEFNKNNLVEKYELFCKDDNSKSVIDTGGVVFGFIRSLELMSLTDEEVLECSNMAIGKVKMDFGRNAEKIISSYLQDKDSADSFDIRKVEHEYMIAKVFENFVQMDIDSDTLEEMINDRKEIYLQKIK